MLWVPERVRRGRRQAPPLSPCVRGRGGAGGDPNSITACMPMALLHADGPTASACASHTWPCARPHALRILLVFRWVHARFVRMCEECECGGPRTAVSRVAACPASAQATDHSLKNPIPSLFVCGLGHACAWCLGTSCRRVAASCSVAPCKRRARARACVCMCRSAEPPGSGGA